MNFLALLKRKLDLAYFVRTYVNMLAQNKQRKGVNSRGDRWAAIFKKMALMGWGQISQFQVGTIFSRPLPSLDIQLHVEVEPFLKVAFMLFLSACKFQIQEKFCPNVRTPEKKV